MQDLIDVTNDAHYENYRSQRLSILTGGGTTITTRYEPLLFSFAPALVFFVYKVPPDA